MTHLDNLVADSLAQSSDTVVHQLASEIERLRSAIADALRPLYEGGHIWVKPLEDAIRKPPENLFHKNCRSCICWNGDMCELISHVCENGEHWRPSAEFVAAHPEVAALADFAEEMRASASRFSVALDAVRADLAARDAEIADLKRGGVVVPELTEDALDIACGPALDPMYGPDAVVYGVRMARREGYKKAWKDLASRLRPIPADRELMRLVDELIRWHGLRPLDKRPDHAAALVGAIKALRAQPTQELAP